MTKPQELGPLVYEVGRDLTLTEYEDIVQQLTEWFTVSRKTTEPGLLARQALEECRKGLTSKGETWKRMTEADLATRIRAKCLYDIEQRRGLGATLEQLKDAKDRAKRKKVAKGWDPKRKRDAFIAPEVENILGPDAVKYGDSPHVLLSSKEEQEWHRLYQGYLKQFPELRSINASSELKIIVDLQILADRYRMRVLSGKAVEVENLTKLTKELADLKKALGIHPDQIAKRVKPKTEATIGAAAAKLEAMGDYREIRARFFLEELLQLYQMYNSPRADGLGFQLDAPGFFGQTRCRTCECAGCGKRNAAGFDVAEIEAYLIAQGALEILPPAAEPEEPAVTMGWVADAEPLVQGSGEAVATYVEMPSDTFETPPLVPDMTVEGPVTFDELPPLSWDDVMDDDDAAPPA